MSITEEISPVNQFNAFLHDWWTPSMAVAFLAFGRNPQSLHFDPDTPTHEHVSIGRMLSLVNVVRKRSWPFNASSGS